MDTNRRDMDEAFLDAAATEAIGAHTPEESDAFIQTLAKADEPSRRAARGLRDAVARLSAASPYMEPPEGLRGKILAATADRTFKMEDYRRSSDTSPRLMRWGMVAAVLFLSASAWYNSSLQNVINKQNQVIGQQKQQSVAMLEQIHRQGEALTKILNPNTKTVALNIGDKVAGKAFLDDLTGQALVVMPEALAQQFAGKQLAMPFNGEQKVYQTTFLATLGGGAASPQADGRPLKIQNLKVDQRPSYVADMVH